MALDCGPQLWRSGLPCQCFVNFKIHNFLTLIPTKEPCFTTSMIEFQVTDGSSQGGCGGTLIADNWVGNLFVPVFGWTLQLFLSL